MQHFYIIDGISSFSYDSFESNKNKLFKVYHYSINANGDERSTAMAYPLTPALKAENIGITKASSISYGGKLVRYKNKTLDMSTTLVDADFLSMFTFPVIKGNAVNSLSDLSNTVLTQNAADKLFGKEDPIGKPVELKILIAWVNYINLSTARSAYLPALLFSLPVLVCLACHYLQLHNVPKRLAYEKCWAHQFPISFFFYQKIL